jgi:ubiquinone/menaquinone biosynthesis C-methylase UbiE
MRRRLLATALLALTATGCSGIAKLDFARIFSRDAWQLPERVIASLEIDPGDRVADLGAGGGYFLPYLAEAVGPTGTVYAVDVDPEITRDLESQVAAEGHANVVVVLGQTDDPDLPDGRIDLVLLVNTYHHIDDRPAYFTRLRGDLGPSGRVAVIDPNAETTGILRLFLDAGHMSFAEDVPTQLFEVFAAGDPAR